MHGTHTEWGQWADNLSMVMYILLPWLINVKEMGRWSVKRFFSVYIAIVVIDGFIRWFDLSITSTGKVVLCCMDGKAEHIIGDVTNTHALDIYNGTRYRYLREHTLDRTQAENPCNTCSFM